MSRRTALLIQNSEYADPGIAKLPRAQAEIEALSDVLASPEAGGFEVALMLDQDVQTLREQIVRLFQDQQEDDVVYIHYSGQALQDQFGELYLTAGDTRADVLDATGLPLRLIRGQRVLRDGDILCGRALDPPGFFSAVGDCACDGER